MANMTAAQKELLNANYLTGENQYYSPDMIALGPLKERSLALGISYTMTLHFGHLVLNTAVWKSDALDKVEGREMYTLCLSFSAQPDCVTMLNAELFIVDVPQTLTGFPEKG